MLNCPVCLSQSSNPTVTTTVRVVLSIWAKPNCCNYSAGCPVRLSQSSNPTITTTILVVLPVWASFQTQLLQLQCLLSCPSETIFKPNGYNDSPCCPIRLKQSYTKQLQLHCLLSCPSEPVFKPTSYNYSACCPVRLSQSYTQLLQRQSSLACPSEPFLHPTVTTTVLVGLSVWASSAPNCYNDSACCLNKSYTQLLQLQHFLSCPSELVLHPTVTTTVLVVLSDWASLQT